MPTQAQIKKAVQQMMDTPQVMLDNETLGTAANAPIIAIGACMFTFRNGVMDDNRIYLPIKLQDAIDSGAVPSGDTISWWMEQSNEARKKFMPAAQKNAFSMEASLEAFYDWLTSRAKEHKHLHNNGKSNLPLWGNGPTFDCGMLAESYERLGMNVPWNFWTERCVRTVRQQGDAIGITKDVLPFQGTPHYALDDAIHQADHIALIQRQLFKEYLL